MVFTVPMRNWNLEPPHPAGVFQICFYSTYEELKHFILLFYKNICSSFYSTYEELKRDLSEDLGEPVELFLQYLWGIETTLVQFLVWFCYKVFTVPMRNWNIN